MSLNEMRQTYAAGCLWEEDVKSDPWVQFSIWFDAAKSAETPDWFEANAMTLSTADPSGSVSSRVVLLKDIADGVMTFYSNYRSTKGRQLDANPNASLCFFWPHLQRQLRIEGTVAKSSRAKTEAYFKTRPRESQIGACVSEQSTVVASRKELETQMHKLDEQFPDTAPPCPDHWGGYDLSPERFEFWQGRPGRLHDRLQYRRNENRWILERLSP